MQRGIDKLTFEDPTVDLCLLISASTFEISFVWERRVLPKDAWCATVEHDSVSATTPATGRIVSPLHEFSKAVII